MYWYKTVLSIIGADRYIQRVFWEPIIIDKMNNWYAHECTDTEDAESNGSIDLSLTSLKGQTIEIDFFCIQDCCSMKKKSLWLDTCTYIHLHLPFLDENCLGIGHSQKNNAHTTKCHYKNHISIWYFVHAKLKFVDES